MNILSLLEQDRTAVLPEGFRILTRSGLLAIGAFLGTQSEDSRGLGRRMNRRVTRARLRGRRRRGLSFERPRLSSAFGSTRFDGSLSYDSTTQGGKARLLLSTVRCRRGSTRTLSRMGRHSFEYPWRTAVSTLGLLRMLSAQDFITRYLGLEWASLGFYVLASVRRGSAYSTEAGLKYFVMGAVSSGIYLFGVSRIYLITGSLQFGERHHRRESHRMALSPIFGRGGSRVRVSFLFKLAIAPFHAWSPDVYEGSPSPSSMYFAVVPKRAMLLVILRLIYGPFSVMFGEFQLRRRGGSARSRLVAALAARSQRRRKRFRAYSSIGHMGYLLLGVSSGTVEGLQSARVYAVVYLVMSISIWVGRMSGSTLISHKRSDGDTETSLASLKYRTDLNGLNRKNSFLARSITISVRSMAGIPPRAGFLPKLWVFRSAISSERVMMSSLAVLASCIGAYYYLRWVKLIYFDGITQGASDGESSSEYTEGESKKDSLKSTSVSLISVDESSSRVLSVCLVRRRGRRRLPGPVRLRCYRMALSLVLI